MKLTAQIIIQIVADYCKLKVSDVVSKDRHGDPVMARHISMYYIREKLKLSFAETGSYFEGKNKVKDHASVLHAIKSVNDQVETDRAYRRIFKEIGNRLKSENKEWGLCKFSISINFRFYYFKLPRKFIVSTREMWTVPFVSPFAGIPSRNDREYSGYREHSL